MNDEFVSAVILGAGAAGFFASIACKEGLAEGRVLLIEKTRAPLAKLKVSGGGRCNVTHHCFDPKVLIQNYPRGGLELLGPFHRFQPKDTIDWFKVRGVELKVEEDGRMFPVTDDSNTIVEALKKAANDAGVEILLEKRLKKADRIDEGFLLEFIDGSFIKTKALLLATGSSKEGYQLAKEFGHTIDPLCPSLFSFNVPDFPLEKLAGVSVELAGSFLKNGKHRFDAPLLITHGGFSGPSILKLSSFEAMTLALKDYETDFFIDWVPGYEERKIREELEDRKTNHGKKTVILDSFFHLPKSLWKELILKAGISYDTTWNHVSKSLLEKILSTLKMDVYRMKGKTPYKSEFVTCGGVKLSEVNFKKMESKLVKNLYFAGEILNIDGVTGGFNFQAAWTTGWIAGKAIHDSQVLT